MFTFSWGTVCLGKNELPLLKSKGKQEATVVNSLWREDCVEFLQSDASLTHACSITV